ncbi:MULTISPECIES: hypothetical protein [unclassified Serratia (in: enterobacteria)]|uniref:hypothetical protein n=1 Tax=unclassified Serratia (in: enterobacteria) TaxID=2647522 RepID=UPI00046A82D5|nr:MULTISPECIES: hypothetical protein [unclassified Serratia (in: enterobacteria)]
MAIKIEAQIAIDSEGYVDVRLFDAITQCVTQDEQVLLEKLKPAFRDFIFSELKSSGLHLLQTYKDECAPAVTH